MQSKVFSYDFRLCVTLVKRDFQYTFHLQTVRIWTARRFFLSVTAWDHKGQLRRTTFHWHSAELRPPPYVLFYHPCSLYLGASQVCRKMCHSESVPVSAECTGVPPASERDAHSSDQQKHPNTGAAHNSSIEVLLRHGSCDEHRFPSVGGDKNVNLCVGHTDRCSARIADRHTSSCSHIW